MGAVLRELKRVQTELAKVKKGAGGAATAGTKGAKGMSSAFGGVNKTLVATAARFLSVGAAIGAITKGLTDLRAAEQAAGQRITDADSGRRALAQVATTRREFNLLVAISEKLRTERGFKAAPAFQLAFSAKSANQVQNIDLFASLREIGFAPEAGIEAVQKLQAGFGGVAGAGSGRAILNKVLAAAGPSPVLASRIASAASSASVPFAAIGGSDEGLLSLLSVFSETFKTPEAAAERIKSISEQVSKKRATGRIKGAGNLKGLALLRALPELAEQGRLLSEGGKPQSVEKFLGEGNAIAALAQIVSQREKIDKSLRNVVAAERQTGGAADLLSQRFEIIGGDPRAAVVLEAQRGAEARALAEENRFAEADKLGDALRDAELATQTKRGRHGLLLAATKAGTATERVLLGREGFIETFLNTSGIQPGDLPQSLRRQLFRFAEERGLEIDPEIRSQFRDELADVARDLKEAATAMKDAANILNRPTPLGGNADLDTDPRRP